MNKGNNSAKHQYGKDDYGDAHYKTKEMLNLHHFDNAMG